MTNNRNVARRYAAQQVVHEHVNRRRGANCQHDWNFIHVVHLKSLDEGVWVAVVLVMTLSEQIFTVTGTKDDPMLKIDTFSRQHVSRFVAPIGGVQSESRPGTNNSP